jgi:hypothetical protein
MYKQETDDVCNTPTSEIAKNMTQFILQTQKSALQFFVEHKGRQLITPESSFIKRC